LRGSSNETPPFHHSCWRRGGAAAWPLAALAQQGDRIRRIGVLTTQSESAEDGPARIGAFVRGLTELGWIDGAKWLELLKAASRPNSTQVYCVGGGPD
jgi:hypothetical protein